MIDKATFEAWLNQEETRQVWEYLKDLKEHLKSEIIGENLENGSTTPIEPHELPLTNSLLGQIEILGVLLKLDHDVIKTFYKTDLNMEENDE